MIRFFTPFRLSALLGLVLGLSLALSAVPASATVVPTDLPDGQCNITAGNTTTAVTSNCINHLSSSGAITATTHSLGDITSTVCNITAGCADAVRTDSGQASAPIDVWGQCRYVDNSPTSGTSLFVPFRTSTEWSAFVANAPSSITNSLCSRPYAGVANGQWPIPSPSLSVPTGSASNPTIGTIFPGSGCSNSLAISTPNLYARAGSVWPIILNLPPESASFTTCRGGSTVIGAQVMWLGLPSHDNDTSFVSWLPTVYYGPDLTFTASAPPPSGTESGTTITILAGTTVTLTWAASPASAISTIGGTTAVPIPAVLYGLTPSSVAITDSVSGASQTSMQASGSVTVTPNATTIYTLTAGANY